MKKLMDTKGKTVVGFFALLLTNLIINWTQGGTPLPIENGQLNWGALAANVLTTLIGTFGVYQLPMPEYNASAGKHEKPELPSA